MTKMKAALVLTAALLTTGLANAADFGNWREGTNTWRGLIGSDRGTMSLGVDYERRMGTMGLGGFLLWSEENDETVASLKAEQMVIGLNTPVHVIDRSPFDVYLAPGIAYMSADDTPAVGATPAGDSETSFGPMMRLGMLYSLNSAWAVGLDFLRVVNWSNDETAGQVDFTNIGVAYSM